MGLIILWIILILIIAIFGGRAIARKFEHSELDRKISIKRQTLRELEIAHDQVRDQLQDNYSLLIDKEAQLGKLKLEVAELSQRISRQKEELAGLTK